MFTTNKSEFVRSAQEISISLLFHQRHNGLSRFKFNAKSFLHSQSEE